MDQDMLKEQQPTIPESKEIEPKEILLERPTVRALGRLLRQQVFTSESLATILGHSNNLQSMVIGKNENFLAFIPQSIQSITRLIGSLEKSKEVKLSNDNGWDFKFSPEETGIEEKPQPGEIILDKDLATKIIAAMHHNFNNKLAPVVGFSQLISGSSEGQAKTESESISVIASELTEKFSAIMERKTGEMKLVTDNEGKTNLRRIEQP